MKGIRWLDDRPSPKLSSNWAKIPESASPEWISSNPLEYCSSMVTSDRIPALTNRCFASKVKKGRISPNSSSNPSRLTESSPSMMKSFGPDFTYPISGFIEISRFFLCHGQIWSRHYSKSAPNNPLKNPEYRPPIVKQGRVSTRIPDPCALQLISMIGIHLKNHRIHPEPLKLVLSLRWWNTIESISSEYGCKSAMTTYFRKVWGETSYLSPLSLLPFSQNRKFRRFETKSNFFFFDFLKIFAVIHFNWVSKTYIRNKISETSSNKNVIHDFN